MKKNRGFTLVELLVVMAIIAILASIVVPNVAAYLRRAQATQALGEINSIELALTKLVSDAGRSGLGDIFTKVPRDYTNTNSSFGSVTSQLGIEAGFMTAGQFRSAIQIYTRTIYALLREGRAILGDNETLPGINVPYYDILDRGALSKLGTQYLDIGEDPFGQLYQIYPGPWPARNLENPFRTYLNVSGDNLPGSTATRKDNLTSYFIDDPETLTTMTDGVGFAAPRDQLAFVWSMGLNTLSGQAVYSAEDAKDGYSNVDKTVYYNSQESELMFGGDDINNWDSNRTWERFY